MASIPDRFENDGLRSLGKYFFYELISIIVAFAAVGALMATGAATNLLSSANSSIAAGALLVFAVLLVVAIVFGALSVFALMFGMRDARRSSLNGFTYYASVSSWLKWLVISDIVVLFVGELILVVGVLLSALGVFSSFASATSITNIQPYMEASAVFELVATALSFLFGYKLYGMYRRLSSDISQRGLSTAAILLLAGIIVLALASVVSIANTLAQPSSALSLFTTHTSATQQSGFATAGIIIEFVGAVMLATSAFFGWRAIKAALA